MVEGVRRRRTDGCVAMLTGLLYVALCPRAAHDPGGVERTAFRMVNQAGGAVPALRLPQQLGTPWVLPGMALAGFLTRRPFLAVSAGLALPVEKALEVGVKKVVRRRRPAEVLDPELHDDAPTDGPSYPSGHAAIAACAAVLAAPYLPRYATYGLATGVGLTTWTRVHQGAHFPLDGVGGVLLGVSVATMLNFAFGLPPSSS
jgi:membrane-associated phospholipid phosphatase